MCTSAAACLGVCAFLVPSDSVLPAHEHDADVLNSVLSALIYEVGFMKGRRGLVYIVLVMLNQHMSAFFSCVFPH